MFFPEGLYTLTPRDQQVTWLEPVLSRQEASLAAVTIGLNYTVPVGKALILQNVFLHGDGGAAQTTDELEIALQLPGSGVGSYTYLEANFTIGTDKAVLTWEGSVIVPERWQVAGAGVWSAGAAANFLLHCVVGVLIPIGNIARV